MVVGQRHSHVECLLRVRACGWLHARWCNERESQVCDPNPYAATRQVRLPPGGAHVYHDLCHEYLTRKPRVDGFFPLGRRGYTSVTPFCIMEASRLARCDPLS